MPERTAARGWRCGAEKVRDGLASCGLSAPGAGAGEPIHGTKRTAEFARRLPDLAEREANRQIAERGHRAAVPLGRAEAPLRLHDPNGFRIQSRDGAEDPQDLDRPAFRNQGPQDHPAADTVPERLFREAGARHGERHWRFVRGREHGIGRLGCFAAGCCYGIPAEGLPAITFTDVHAHAVTGVPLNVPLHPTQLYEAGLEFALFLFLLWLAPRRKFQGQLFLTWAIVYPVSRFMIEFLRGDPRGFVLDGLLSTSQFVGIWIVAAAVISLLVLRRRTA